MDSSSDERDDGPEHIPVFQRAVDMFEEQLDVQRLLRLGILADVGCHLQYGGPGAEVYGFQGRVPGSGASEPTAGGGREEEKAEKKRLKRQKRKERKRCEKQEKGEDSAEGNKEAEATGEEREKAEAHGDDASAEELDLTSTFVSKARSKLEQKPKAEREKKTAAGEKKAAAGSQTAEEHVKRSTQLANLGNRHAAAGDFQKAVIFYTDAIKYNPREYKLFGNRSFCFERMRLYMKALDDAELSLGLKPGWDKGLFRKGKALAGLKRYEEAERAFGMVVEADGSRADVAEELRRVQIAQLSEYGYTPEQSARALDFHASVKKALCFLSGANRRAGESSPWARSAFLLHLHEWFLKRLPAVSEPRAAASRLLRELYPVWVGNLFGSVSERQLEQLFSKAGSVDSVRLLTAKRCAFVNFTRQEDGEKAIQQFHGCELNGNRLVVRYPDRIPAGLARGLMT